MFKKFVALPLVMITLVMGLAACNSEEEVDKGEVVALVNDQEIYEEEWQMLSDSIASQQKMQLQQAGIDPESEEGKKYIEQIESDAEESALEQLIQKEAILQEANANEYSVESEAIESQFEDTKAQFETDEKFNTVLEENGLTQETYRAAIEDQLITKQYLDDNIDSVEITDEQVQNAYDEYKTTQEERDTEPEAFEDIKTQIKDSLKREKENEQIQKIVQEIMDDAEIERLI